MEQREERPYRSDVSRLLEVGFDRKQREASDRCARDSASSRRGNARGTTGSPEASFSDCPARVANVMGGTSPTRDVLSSARIRFLSLP